MQNFQMDNSCQYMDLKIGVINHQINDQIKGVYYKIDAYFETAFKKKLKSDYLRNFIYKYTNYYISREIN